MQSKGIMGLPNYEVVPLEYDDIGVAAVQMNPNRLVDPKNPKKVIRENLDKMLFLSDMALQFASMWPTGMTKLNLMVFPEFSLTGYDFGLTRDDWQRIAIDVPGEETEVIGKKAKELDCFIAFASHTKDKDWPGHYFNTSMIIDPNGEVIHKHWKAYCNGPGMIEWATTVHDVLDEFLERYGWDAVWPVARTPIGNIATFTCSESFAPETARAYAFQGAEILALCIAGGGDENKTEKYKLQFRASCASSQVYGVYANGTNGGSMIVDYFGRILNQAKDCRDTIIYDSIPMASFRAKHEKPFIRTEIYAPVLEKNPGRYPSNLYSKYGVPFNNEEAYKLANQHTRYPGTDTANR
ncbi:nitrilase-related carbon-nitrogen hydrolase [Chloroflexota bacterium]